MDNRTYDLNDMSGLLTIPEIDTMIKTLTAENSLLVKEDRIVFPKNKTPNEPFSKVHEMFLQFEDIFDKIRNSRIILIKKIEAGIIPTIIQVAELRGHG